MTTITLAYEVSNEAEARVRDLLDHVARNDVNWNGADFKIVRDDFTGFGDEAESYERVILLRQIERAISGEE